MQSIDGQGFIKNLRRWLEPLLVPVLAILTAVIVGGVIIKSVGGDPIAAYRGLLQGAFGTRKALSETTVWATPYIFAGLAVAFAFKGGLFNIGAEGQLAFGAVTAALIGYAMPHWLNTDIPAYIHFVLALLVAGLIWWLLWKTTLGFEIRTVGANPDAAKYAGINVKRIIIITMAISGLLAGLAGAIEVTALNYRHELGFAVGYGFDAIAIALLGKTNPFGVVLAAILFGAMRNGGTRMQFLTQIPVDIISVIQALILLFVAADAIIRFIYRIRVREERVVLTRGWGG